MQIKNKLRKTLKEARSNVSDKSEKADLILQRLISLEEYKSADTLLCYVSFGDEVDTHRLIKLALKDGKTVAVPYCQDRGIIEFYIINSLDELKLGAYGIKEPDINFNKRLEVPENSIIIVPGLAFNRFGFRIGYGGGYYDRFLENYKHISVGLCYNDMLFDEIPTEKYDMPVGIVVTDKQIIYTGGGKDGF